MDQVDQDRPAARRRAPCRVEVRVRLARRPQDRRGDERAEPVEHERGIGHVLEEAVAC